MKIYFYISYDFANNYYHIFIVIENPNLKRGIATNTTFLIPLFNFTLFKFTIKILMAKVPLYPSFH